MQNDLSPAAPAPGLCALSDREPAAIDALDDTRPVRVCQRCSAYETGEHEEDAA